MDNGRLRARHNTTIAKNSLFSPELSTIQCFQSHMMRQLTLGILHPHPVSESKYNTVIYII
jgi:hypothetical protein